MQAVDKVMPNSWRGAVVWWLLLSLGMFGFLVALQRGAAAQDILHETGRHVFPTCTNNGPRVFAKLNSPTPRNGDQVYCRDCLQTNPCAQGTVNDGAEAFYIDGVWQCGAGTLGPPGVLTGVPPTSVDQIAVWNDTNATQLKGTSLRGQCAVGQAARGIDIEGDANGCYVTLVPAGVDGNLQTKSGGSLAAYAGTGPCTNGISTLNASGIATCVPTTTSTTTITTSTTTSTTTTTLFIPSLNTFGSYTSGRWFMSGAQQCNGAGSAAVNTATGAGRLEPMYVGRTVTWDRIGMHGSTSATNQVRLLVYELDETTLMPTALLRDAGTSAINVTRPILVLSPALTTTAKWLGLAVFVESGSGNATPTSHICTTQDPLYYGSPGGGAGCPLTLCIGSGNPVACCTGSGTGTCCDGFNNGQQVAVLRVSGLGTGAPAVGAWTISQTVTSADLAGSGVWLRVQ